MGAASAARIGEVVATHVIARPHADVDEALPVLDIEGALKEVADSNDSKFDDEGRPIFNEQLKIMKGPNYFRPQLVKFTPQIRA